MTFGRGSRIVLSHFFNEAYLLPWWLKHHREIYDHGVLVDYGSTDESVDICRELVPTWEVVKSENAHFDAVLADFEMMKHESRFPDAWKIVLNTTEFLIVDNLKSLEDAASARGYIGIRMGGAVMVDNSPSSPPLPDRPLVKQKYFGIWEGELNFGALQIPGLLHPTRNRLHHRYTIGSYAPGRHVSHLPGQAGVPEQVASIWWYAFSPWTPEFKARKLQINAKRGPFDKAFGFGAQHEAEAEELDRRWAKLRGLSKSLIRG